MAIEKKPWQRLLYEIWASVTEGHAFEVEELNVTENGTYTADEFKAYSPVTVDVAGGASFGSLQYVPIEFVEPEINGETTGTMNIFSISSGDTVIAGGNAYFPIGSPVAAGLTAVSLAESQYTECDAYVCSVDENYLYTSVTPWDGTVTVGSVEQQGETYATYTLTVPELDFDPETYTGECLVLYVHR